MDAAERLIDRDPFGVVGYRGYASADRALILGRVLQDEGIARADPSQGRWRNLRNALKRLESDPLPFARVQAALGDDRAELTADDEGFIHRWLPLRAPPPAPGWHPVHLELIGDPAARGRGTVLLPSTRARFGVVSDMDDTVLQSHVTDFVRAARLVLLENARTRLPFHGVAAFYRALESGTAAGATNPIFYVSNSPWNLYDVVEDFLEAEAIPAGPLLLRDWDLGLSLRRRPSHKATAIPEILATYPQLPFVLVGDSGQEDPEIYGSIVGTHPGRILAVYIRNVTRHPERDAAIRHLADEVKAAGSTLVLADDTLAIARHAAEHGWIAAAALDEIGEEKREDEGTAPGKAPAPGVGPSAGAPTVVVDDTT